MVINNDPCYAYLLECNHMVDQKIVMAHVHGHCDFFKNNIWFSKTNRKMMDTMANHATKTRKYIDKYGLDVVESFVDLCLSIDDLIDHHSPFIERRPRAAEPQDERGREKTGVKRIHGRLHQSEEFIEQQSEVRR
jgi:stage V sporulation protein R